MIAAMSSTSQMSITGAGVGSLLADANDSALAGLMIDGERAILASGGDDGAALFTSSRVIIAEQVGIMNRRLAVKAFRRDSILGYGIDPDKAVILTLHGHFGTAALVFDPGFDPMVLSQWLGETLASTSS
jgi:hypothetical protein